MKRLILLFFVVANMAAAAAQDVIVQKDGNELQVKVTEVGETAVKYKKFDNLDGPVYTISKSDCFMIKYQNGSKDVFQTAASPQNKAVIPELSPSFLPVLSYGSGNVLANGIALSKDKIRTLYAGSPQALAMYNKGINLNVAGGVLTGIGAGCTGVSLGFSIALAAGTSVYTNYYFVPVVIATATVGLATIIPGLILNSVGNRKVRQSVNLYNSSLNTSSFDDINLHLGLTSSGGLGVQLVF